MRVEVRREPLCNQDVDALIVPVFEDSNAPDEGWRLVDREVGGLISQLLKTGEFRASANRVMSLHTPAGMPAGRVILVGMGKRKAMVPRTTCEAFGAAIRKIRELRKESAAGLVPVGRPAADFVSAAVEGVVLGQYEYKRYQTNDTEKLQVVERFVLAAPDRKDTRSLEKFTREGLVKADCVAFARDLQNAPANDLAPQGLAAAAESMADEAGLSCEVWDDNDLRRWGMNTLLAVGQGSSNAPRFVLLKHEPKRNNGPFVILAGKGITFDSGGISLKPGRDMDEMKFDMSGAAAVMGALRAAADLALPAQVWGLIPAAENMPGGRSTRPGDIVKTYSGKTVEITNTDAEGRLVLCDALAYAAEQKPDAIVDVATLTGACVVALGHVAAGMMGNDRALMDRMKEAGDRSGDRVWELPMWDAYDELVKSKFADLNNAGPPRIAGAICGAKFLEPFVGEVPWVHLDVAGTAWGGTETPTTPKELGSGFGVRLLTRYLQNCNE
ncbi:MAG: hypothetical protein AUJ92_16130 [Armatimonadetes bacterium CG2_30_59_28]|nr:leucyl aminopeptidase [Armatimonadota bacterium]OIO91624.1 MAG: hypothetical protein AUJ92_16130 [Armatimonadetes bacterium CG2_30_59_28]